ncbi:MOSC domain-containing protein [Nocardia sp. alder85J]|uniref:MOSC domain-containing protein n=1 Tax=Nocardia sp. alder85J TaxID=2862949 RepID=UPI001CD52158|nr:MOSC domain-containing protein [Nocardia sp. alder85J]MCX4093367.1 MOSC domain-containing protein [Nocardia sp. alder85J]
MSGADGRVLAVCVVHTDVELPHKISRVGRTAIDKRPVTGRIRAEALGLDGDHVCDTKNHGGADQAVYAYAEEDAETWSRELGRPLPSGWFGENLRVTGLRVSDSVIGERWLIGEAVFEVSAPRVPCSTFQHWSGEQHWVKRFTLRANTGAYLRVLTPGTVGAGDEIRVDHVPAHGVTVRDLFTGADPDRLTLLLAAEPTVSDDVRMQVDRHARRAGAKTRAQHSNSTAEPARSAEGTA